MSILRLAHYLPAQRAAALRLPARTRLPFCDAISYHRVGVLDGRGQDGQECATAEQPPCRGRRIGRMGWPPLSCPATGRGYPAPDVGTPAAGDTPWRTSFAPAKSASWSAAGRRPA